MDKLIILLSTSSVILMLTHEYDAIHFGEWKMFKFLQRFSNQVQYLIFLYAHIPFTLFLFYYLWTVVSFSNIVLWIIVNLLLIVHFGIHLLALRWESNVFHSIYSFVIIGAAALMGIINLCLIQYF